MGITRRDGAVFGLGVLTGIGLSIAGIVVLGLFITMIADRIMQTTPEFIVAEKRPEAPYDWAVTSLDGKALPLEELKDRVVFLNFWATWCGPCRKELPSLQKLVEGLKDEPVAMVFVSREDPEVVSGFLKKNGWTIPAYTIDGEPPHVLDSPSLPTTFILDRQGRIALQHVGTADWAAESVVAGIRALTRDEEPVVVPASPPSAH